MNPLARPAWLVLLAAAVVALVGCRPVEREAPTLLVLEQPVAAPDAAELAEPEPEPGYVPPAVVVDPINDRRNRFIGLCQAFHDKGIPSGWTVQHRLPSRPGRPWAVVPVADTLLVAWQDLPRWDESHDLRWLAWAADPAHGTWGLKPRYAFALDGQGLWRWCVTENVQDPLTRELVWWLPPQHQPPAPAGAVYRQAIQGLGTSQTEGVRQERLDEVALDLRRDWLIATVTASRQLLIHDGLGELRAEATLPRDLDLREPVALVDGGVVQAGGRFEGWLVQVPATANEPLADRLIRYGFGASQPVRWQSPEPPVLVAETFHRWWPELVLGAPRWSGPAWRPGTAAAAAWLVYPFQGADLTGQLRVLVWFRERGQPATLAASAWLRQDDTIWRYAMDEDGLREQFTLLDHPILHAPVVGWSADGATLLAVDGDRVTVWRRPTA